MAAAKNGVIEKGEVSQKEPRKQNLPAWIVNPIGAESRPLCELSDDELYKKCRECGQNAKEWSRKFAALLPEVAKRRLHRRKGFISLGEFAGKVAGMSEYAVDRILYLHARIKDKPALLKLFESGTEGWSKIEVVSFVATIETEKSWAEKITLLSMGALSELVKNYRLKTIGADEAQNKTLFGQDPAGGDGLFGRAGFSGQANSGQGQFFEPPVRFSFPASREVEFDLRLAKQRLEKQTKQPLSWNETFQMIIEKSDLAKSKILPTRISKEQEVCARCAKKKAVMKICEECSRKPMPGALGREEAATIKNGGMGAASGAGG